MHWVICCFKSILLRYGILTAISFVNIHHLNSTNIRFSSPVQSCPLMTSVVCVWILIHWGIKQVHLWIPYIIVLPWHGTSICSMVLTLKIPAIKLLCNFIKLCVNYKTDYDSILKKDTNKRTTVYQQTDRLLFFHTSMLSSDVVLLILCVVFAARFLRRGSGHHFAILKLLCDHDHLGSGVT